MIQKLIDWIRKQIWLHKKSKFSIVVAKDGEIEAEIEAQYAGNQELNTSNIEF
jgi:hypothetical protein